MPFAGTATNKKPGDGESRPITPKGNHPAVLVAMVDLGTQTVEMFGDRTRTREVRQVYLVWELTMRVIDGGSDNHVIGKVFTLSYHEKAGLRQLAESLRDSGEKYQEGESIDYSQLLGSKCLAQVTHGTSENSGRTYAKLDRISQVVDGMNVPAPKHKPFLFDLATDTPDMLPGWLPWIIGQPVSDVVKKAREMKTVDSPESAVDANDPDCPF